jgi:hypothetical protein
MEITLKPPGTQCLKLKCDKQFSNFAFNFNLSHCNVHAMAAVGGLYAQVKEYEQAVEWFTKGAEAGLPEAMFNLSGSGLADNACHVSLHGGGE